MNVVSYGILKNKILARQKWDLNICSGRTDGGGVNADVRQYIDLPHFVLVSDIYHLPFRDKEFKTVLCSHTMEHVDDPDAFWSELNRVGGQVTLVLPPLWDLGAAFNVFEHKWLFLIFTKEHSELPRRTRLPFATRLHKSFGQRYHA